MFRITTKLDRVSFETNGRQNLQKTADFVIESIVFCPLVPPSWISLVDPTSAMYASAIYVSYIYGSIPLQIVLNISCPCPMYGIWMVNVSNIKYYFILFSLAKKF